MFFVKKSKKTMNLNTLRANKTPILHTDEPPYNQNVNTTEAKKIVKSGTFLAGGVAVQFLLNA